MYNLPHFKEKDNAVITDFMKQHPFAMLIGVGADNGPVATQIPILIKEREGQLYLQGHMMRQTDHCKAFEMHQQALVVFTGPHSYVSASWYKHKQQASTWNYMAVHAKGSIQFLDHGQLLVILDETTSHFENNPSSPALYKELSVEYVERLAKAIVAFEIRVDSLEHVFKLSQNKDQHSYEHIIDRLKQQDADAAAIAAEMEKRKKHLF
jgi:transcriptional regulator